MRHRTLATPVTAAVCALLTVSLSACGNNEIASQFASSDKNNDSTTQLSGEYRGSGASSQQAAVEAWVAGFTSGHKKTRVGYDPSGSGAGVTTFLTGATAWAGSDAPLTDEQVAQSQQVCASGTAFDIPVYVSPIAVVFHLNGISGKGETLNLDAVTLAKIFNGKITRWSDPAIASQNKGVKLPNIPITVVHRSDKSGTTKNFLSYIKDTAGQEWPYEVGENWPNEVGQGAKGTSGVINTVSQADGTIGYADASQAQDLGTIAIKVGEDYVPYSAEAAAKVVDASPLDAAANQAGRVVVALDHTTDEPGAYPIVLISYGIACPAYQDKATGEFVKSWLSYVVSEEGQRVAASAAGSAPLSNQMRKRVMKSITSIQ